MIINSIRNNIDITIAELNDLRDLILNTQSFGEEMVRVNEMLATMVTFAAYEDEQLDESLSSIERICEGIHDYVKFLKSAM